MIFKKKRFLFNIIRLVLEPWPNIDELKDKYSAIYILSYDKKILPSFSVKEKNTPVIYLSKSINEIFSNFNSTTRNEIRKTFDNKIPGLDFIVDDQNLAANYELSVKFEKEQGRLPDRFEDYVGCRIFSAYYQRELISSIICFDNGRVLRAKAICSKRLGIENRDLYKIISYSTRRLVYEICKYGQENKYQLFDLGSVNFTKENLAKFKMGFTSDLIKEYTYTYQSFWIKLLSQGMVIKKMIKKLLKK